MARDIERRGIEVAIRYLRSGGHDPEDVSDEKRGYDLWCRHCQLRIEVKASRAGRQSAGSEIDIRTCVWPPVANQGNNGEVVVVVREGLPFDALVEVCWVDRLEPEVYLYPREAVTEFGEFRVKPLWHFTLGNREQYKLYPPKARSEEVERREY